MLMSIWLTIRSKPHISCNNSSNNNSYNNYNNNNNNNSPLSMIPTSIP